jgi:[acyl-carrier-protein] S-malonyltransferase
MNNVFLFQGQGSQLVGMGKELYDYYPLVREVYDQANETLGEDITSIIFNGPKEILDLTEHTQPALMLHSISILKLIEHLAGKKINQFCSYLAGHSLGEYSAICAARVINIETTLKLLKLRGKSMQNAAPIGSGAMAALLGVEYEYAQEITNLASKFGICEIANDNCNGQIVISGQNSAIDQAITIAKEMGKKAIKLDVSAPFHCSMMSPAQEVMSKALEKVEFTAPLVPLVANVSAEPTKDPEQIKRMLIEQVSSQVKWRQSILNLVSMGANDMYEIGTGKVLVGLNKRIDSNINSYVLNNPETIENFVKSIT